MAVVANKTKVLSVQLGNTLSFVKFVLEWGVVEGQTLDYSSLTLKRPTYQVLPPAMPRTLLKVFGGSWWWFRE